MRKRTRGLERCHGVGQLPFDPLKLTDRLIELLALLGVVDCLPERTPSVGVGERRTAESLPVECSKLIFEPIRAARDHVFLGDSHVFHHEVGLVVSGHVLVLL